MYWENKLEELGKLAPVVLQMIQRGKWTAQILANIRMSGANQVVMGPIGEGGTPAGAADDLWSKLVIGFEPILLYEPGKPVRRIRYNARWEDVAIEVKPEVTTNGTVRVETRAPVDKPVPELPGGNHEHKAIVVEEEQPGGFDPSE